MTFEFKVSLVFQIIQGYRVSLSGKKKKSNKPKRQTPRYSELSRLLIWWVEPPIP